MAVYEITDPSTGQTLEIEGDSPPTNEELEHIFDRMPQSDYFGSGVIEPVRSIASGVTNTIEGGLEGLVQAVNPLADQGDGAKAVKEAQAKTFTPKTPSGQKNLETISDLIEKGIDIANLPISGLGGIVELVSGQGLEQAAKTIKAIQQSGLSKTLGNRTLDETGSPLAATVAETLPTAVGSALGMKGALKVSSAVDAKATVNATGKAIENVFKYQTPTKRRIAGLLADKSGHIDTAKYILDQGRAVKDSAAVSAITQGFDEGVVAAIKNASPLDKIKMQRMTDIMYKGIKNKRYSSTNRPADVAGNSLVERVKFIQKTNEEAGLAIDKTAQTLKGQQLDISVPTSNFSESLDALGITINRGKNGRFIPNFELSELPIGDRGPIREVVRQMSIKSQDGIPDAFAVHKMKRIIDRNVTYGNVKTGMSSDAERILKRFRRELDAELDANFPEYNAANVKYADTIGALDDLQDAVGSKLDFSSPSADKASGTVLRRVMSNAQSRANLIDSLDGLERIAKKSGGKFDDDLLNQALFADELDRVFGPVARTSLQGQTGQNLERAIDASTSTAGMVGAAKDMAVKAAVKARGINEDNAFKAIMDLLRDKNFKPS